MTLSSWWGEFDMVAEEALHWSLGARLIALKRLDTEWHIWNIEAESDAREILKFGAVGAVELEAHPITERRAQRQTSTTIKVFPALADRPVVAKLAAPLRVLGNEETRLYVSTPLWINIVTHPIEKQLIDVPFWRPSDSWFGASTMHGELCYAKYTDAQVELALMEHRPYRALTPVTVINRHTEPLLIERLNIPVSLLSVYHNSANQLWSNAVTLIRETSDDRATLELEKGLPAELGGDGVLINGPRIASETPAFIRTINSLFA